MKNKGITLVALVITIIILLILAGITIAQLTGSGLFENARLAETEYKNSQKLENSILSDYENKIGEYVGNKTEDNVTENIEDNKKLYLYKEGDECTDITGGWERGGYNSGTFTKNDNYMNLALPSSGSTIWNSCQTVNEIDVTGYKKLVFELEDEYSLYSSGLYYNYFAIALINSNVSGYDNYSSCYKYDADGRVTKTSTAGIRRIRELELDDDVQKKVCITCSKWYNTICSTKIYNVWLEK